MTPLRALALAPAKVNLCLFLGPTRPDGRHELVSVVEALSLADDVELSPAPPDATADEVHCPGVEGPNLALEALARFREATGWDAPSQRITIRKRVPVDAGMGGGSSDAAAILRLAAAASNRGGEDELLELARSLGSDVPAQLRPGAALVTGAGEHVRALEPLEPHGALVLPSAHRLSTAEVFARADELGLPRTDGDLAARLDEARHAFSHGRALVDAPMINDLEPAAVSLCPAIEEAFDSARRAGADRVLVSGSGPTVVGLFFGERGPGRAAHAARSLADRWPGACAAVPVDADFGGPRTVEPTP